MNYESMNKGGKRFLKYINQDNESVTCRETNRKHQKFSKMWIDAEEKVLSVSHVVGANCLLLFLFLPERGGEKSQTAKNQNTLGIGN